MLYGPLSYFENRQLNSEKERERSSSSICYKMLQHSQKGKKPAVAAAAKGHLILRPGSTV